MDGGQRDTFGAPEACFAPGCLGAAPSLPQVGIFADSPLLSAQGQSCVTPRSAAHPSTHRENVHLVSKAMACLQAASQDSDVQPIFGGPCDLETMVEALSWPLTQDLNIICAKFFFQAKAGCPVSSESYLLSCQVRVKITENINDTFSLADSQGPLLHHKNPEQAEGCPEKLCSP